MPSVSSATTSGGRGPNISRTTSPGRPSKISIATGCGAWASIAGAWASIAAASDIVSAGWSIGMSMRATGTAGVRAGWSVGASNPATGTAAGWSIRATTTSNGRSADNCGSIWVGDSTTYGAGATSAGRSSNSSDSASPVRYVISSVTVGLLKSTLVLTPQPRSSSSRCLISVIRSEVKPRSK